MGTYYDGGGGGGGGSAADWTDLNDTPAAISPDELVLGDATGSNLTFAPQSDFVEGTKYVWVDAADRASQTGMRTNELGVQRNTGEVFKWSGSAWVFFYNLADGSPAATPLMIKGPGNPNGTVTGAFGQGYLDTVTGITYEQVADPSGTVWRLT